MNCKCGNDWCGKCGRFLNGGQRLDPGDKWSEPLSSDAVSCEGRINIINLEGGNYETLCRQYHCFSRRNDGK